MFKSPSKQLLAALIVFSISLYFWHSQWDLWSDVAFYIASNERMLAGGKLYFDIIDMNPPLAFALTYPPVKFAQVFSLDAQEVYRFGVFALIWSSTIITWHILRRSSFDAEVSLKIVLAFFLVIALPTGPAFGQREHLSIILILPYLALAAGRIQGCKVTVWLAALVGVFAGIGFGLKPFFLFAIIFIELGMIGWRKHMFAVGNHHYRIVFSLLSGCCLDDNAGIFYHDLGSRNCVLFCLR